jgi:hypothetical protein
VVVSLEVLMGAELAFTGIMTSFVAFSSAMTDSIFSLVISLSSSGVSNAILVASTSCQAAPSLACIVILSAFLTVTSHISFTIYCAIA